MDPPNVPAIWVNSWLLIAQKVENENTFIGVFFISFLSTCHCCVTIIQIVDVINSGQLSRVYDNDDKTEYIYVLKKCRIQTYVDIIIYTANATILVREAASSPDTEVGVKDQD